MIGLYPTEINVTSPTGLQEISPFDGVDLPAQIWDATDLNYKFKLQILGRLPRRPHLADGRCAR